MADIQFLKARLFLEQGKRKRVVALFKIKGWYLNSTTSAVQNPVPDGGFQNYVSANKAMKRVIENGERVTYLKALYLGPVLKAKVRDLTFVNDFTFTITLTGESSSTVTGPDVPADDFDPCDYS
ncbi:hypothetical protein GC170_13390 [bacterium]|nr:hypothetical protein [bacterium]